jgi:hypothetical protein
MDRVGSPSPRFASRGVYNVCLGPRAKKPELRGDHVVVAIFDKNDWVVRELREDLVDSDGSAVDVSTGEPLGKTYRLVDVCPTTGQVTVLSEDSKAVIGDSAKWLKLLDTWSAEHGVTQ